MVKSGMVQQKETTSVRWMPRVAGTQHSSSIHSDVALNYSFYKQLLSYRLAAVSIFLSFSLVILILRSMSVKTRTSSQYLNTDKK